ncbi:MAG: glycosyltransferase family 2 protein [Lachnospiraceae bacterium]|nr:glycosyltransferase family 2 protein [Lachnospiraceae bacterium]
MNIAVSIIIPVYNAGDFLRKGLDSCVNQTLQNIEIICVNDASTDQSAEVIQEYVNKYPEKVILLTLTQNSGDGGARNQGILHARGEYLCFMDSDDYLDIHLCEDIYKEAKKQDADMVFYDFIRMEGGQEYPSELIGQEEIDCWHQLIGRAVWLQMIKREIILKHKLLMPENILNPDEAITPLWKYYAKKRCKVQKPYYYYVNRAGSLMNETSVRSVISPITDVVPCRYQIMQEKGLLKQYTAESDFMIAKDISGAFMRLWKLNYRLTMDELFAIRRKLEVLDGHILDESLMDWNLSCAEKNIVKDFLYCPEKFAEKNYDYASFVKMQIEEGMDRNTEAGIKDILSTLQQKFGKRIAVWGVGEVGIPLISTLIRMGYDFQVYDNTKHGQEIWKDAHKYIHAFEDLEQDEIDVVLVASTIYYRAIEKQIHGTYADIAVVDFMRMIRQSAPKWRRHDTSLSHQKDESAHNI